MTRLICSAKIYTITHKKYGYSTTIIVDAKSLSDALRQWNIKRSDVVTYEVKP